MTSWITPPHSRTPTVSQRANADGTVGPLSVAKLVEIMLASCRQMGGRSSAQLRRRVCEARRWRCVGQCYATPEVCRNGFLILIHFLSRPKLHHVCLIFTGFSWKKWVSECTPLTWRHFGLLVCPWRLIFFIHKLWRFSC